MRKDCDITPLQALVVVMSCFKLFSNAPTPAAAAAAAPAAVPAAAFAAASTAEKTGAGLLLCCQGHVLLLKRSSNHNDKTWGLPGGNVEPTDQSLLGTATREASEELGIVPPFETRAQILTKRGKRDQKHYTVFIADVHPSVQQQYIPRLNKEHSDWKWVPWVEVLRGNLELHPVVKKLAERHALEVTNVLNSCMAPAGQG